MSRPAPERSGAGAAASGLRPADSERLVGAIQDLSTARTFESIQETVRHAARDLTGADGATFVLRDGDQCFYVDEDAIEPLWKGRRFPMSACLSGWVILNREPAVVPDVYDDPRVPIDAYRPTFVKSLAMVPIRMARPVGAIGNYWARPHLASAAELRLLQALADSTSIAIENVTLLEELRTAKESAEEASRLKDEFLATVSHELRTPLNPIVTWSGALRDESLSEHETREAAARIHAAALRHLDHVNALLDVSRIIAGRLRLDAVRTSLVPIVEAAIEAVAPAARAKGIRVRLVTPDAIPEVRVNPERMQQVAWNLLSNAVKFTPTGGTVRVSLECAPESVELVVADSGAGIASEFAPHLFERFRQADGSNARVAEGMGLGLAMVRHLVELHGGTVRAESPGTGRGSTFTVSLPRTDPKSRTRTGRPKPGRPAGRS